MPIPPPGAITAPSDDWTDDPSFDLSPDRSFPGSSPSSSTSSRGGRPSLGQIGGHSGSPLRQMHNLQPRQPLVPDTEDDDFDDFDDDAFADAGATIKALPQPLFTLPGTSSPPPAGPSSTTSPMRNLTATVIGPGPAGVGTITRLGSAKPSSQALPAGSVRARAKAIEKQWEADVDLDAITPSRLRKTLAPTVRKVVMPEADALDDLGFDLDEDDQATLKASATLKAMLPPPRNRNGSGGDTVKALPSGLIKQKPTAAKTQQPPMQEDDLETDLVLPLNLTNLTLATQSQPAIRPRQSMTSVTTEWDSPSTCSGGKAGRFSWGDESAHHGRTLETSLTSVSEGPPDMTKDDFMDDEEEDYEVDLVIPDPAFFTSRRTTVLNSILDKKRKQQYAPPPQLLQLDSTRGGGDDSFEDGLVFDNPRAELSQRRLEKNRRMRTIPVPFTLGAERKTKAAPPALDRDRMSLGRQSPSVPTSAREGASSSLGRASGRRNLSAGSQKDSRSRPTSPLAYMREQRDPTQPRTSRKSYTSANMPPPLPPPPVPSSSRLEPATPSRLRHQKSFHHPAPPQSPSLARKQSLASLQDAIAAGHVRPDTDLPPFNLHQLRPSKSSSRLAMPTASSLAKIRPPAPSSQPPRQPFPRVRGAMEMTRRTKQWGDGTELEGIEDLRVETPSTPHSANYPKLGRKSLEKSPGASKDETRKKSGGKPRRQRQPAMLIKNLGAVDKKKVVGEMTWNPLTLRWEGNEAILRDFDTVASSARPALITHFTGSSGTHSPLTGGGAAAVRIVGDMKFDPEQMRWVSLLPPEEDEPDPFEGMADDEDDEGQKGTLTRLSGRKLMSIGLSSGASTAPSAPSNRFVSESTHSIATTTASWEDRTLPQVGTEIPPELWAECRDAEARHRREMRGWTLRPVQSASDLRDRDRREEKRLWEVRNLALRS